MFVFFGNYWEKKYFMLNYVIFGKKKFYDKIIKDELWYLWYDNWNFVFYFKIIFKKNYVRKKYFRYFFLKKNIKLIIK